MLDPQGRVAIELKQNPPRKVELPAGMKEPGDPKKLNQDELYHAGEWLDKFVRTREALPYYEEALRRDPQDTRVNVEMGRLASEKGLWDEALRHFGAAQVRDTENTKLFFGKAVALLGKGDYKAAYEEFYRATGGLAESAPAFLNLARLDLRFGRLPRSGGKGRARPSGATGEFPDSPALAATAWRHLGDRAAALAAAERALALDAMHFQGGYEKLLALQEGGDARGRLGLGEDLARHHARRHPELSRTRCRATGTPACTRMRTPSWRASPRASRTRTSARW